jgi:hypothetical protein
MSYLLRAETSLHYFLVWLEASKVGSQLIPRRDARNSISIRNLTARDFKTINELTSELIGFPLLTSSYI